MKHEEMWKKFSKENNLESQKYTSWAFGGAPDELAEMTLKEIKTATSSAYILYDIDGEEIPKIGEYSIVLNSKKEAVCIIQTTKISIIPFNRITEKEAVAEGDGSLKNWKKIHEKFFTNYLKPYNIEFNENMLLVYEKFKLVYK